jgi:membrane protein DedA with SNARE-associated domain
MNYKKLALVAFIGVLIGLYVHYDLGQYLSLQSLKSQQAAIEAFRTGNPLLSIAGYFVGTSLSLPFHFQARRFSRWLAERSSGCLGARSLFPLPRPWEPPSPS